MDQTVPSVPRVVIWELTQACALACVHCRAEAQPRRNPYELSTAEGKVLLGQMRALGNHPIVVFSGGDPLEREDFFELLEHARHLGLHVSVTPSATPRLTLEALTRMKELGVSRVALSLDGADPVTHDKFRGVRGSFERTQQAALWCKQLRLPIQINTTVCKRNVTESETLASLAKEWGAVLWNVFFLLPVGRGARQQALSGEECEALFPELSRLSETLQLALKTTEAPHYRRFQRQRQSQSGRSLGAGAAHGSTQGIGDGRGFVFISHLGEVFPSGFLASPCGNIRERSLGEIYSQHPLMRSLRNVDAFKGKCGVCEYRQLCGGARARAYAVTGDALESDPSCIYIPQALRLERPAAGRP